MNPRSLSILLVCLTYALRSTNPLPTQATLTVPSSTQRPASRPTQRPSSVAAAAVDARQPLQQQQQEQQEDLLEETTEDKTKAEVGEEGGGGGGGEGASSHLRHRKWRLHSRWRKMARRGAAGGAEGEGIAGSAGEGRVPHRTVVSEPHASLRWTTAPPSAASVATTSSSLPPLPTRVSDGPGSTEPPPPHPVEAGVKGGEVVTTVVTGTVGDAKVVVEVSTESAGKGEEGEEGSAVVTEEGTEDGGAMRPAHGLSHTVGGGEDRDEEVEEEEEQGGERVRDAVGGKKDDIVSRFLRIVESQQQHALGGNCTAGTELSLGDGVVDRYAQERFRVEAEVAVNRANMLTRLWKYAPSSLLASEYLLHASLFSMVEFDEDIFAAGNCYDAHQYGNNHLYCPYAYRLPEGPILVKDLAVEYKYLTNSSEWFFLARQNANRVIRNFKQFRRGNNVLSLFSIHDQGFEDLQPAPGYNTYTYNETAHTEREPDEILSVIYEDGKWSRPYYDCGGGNIWMLTYTVPFFGYVNGTYFFKGTSGIDIDLRRVDIDQCPLPPFSTQLNIFAASDKCKKRTTECEAIPGLGFRRGSYKCICREGFYFPDTDSDSRYYNGSHIEMEYERLIMGEESIYSEPGAFECVPCAEGCERCVDGSPCIAELNWVLRSAVLCLSLATVLLLLPPLLLFTWKYAHVKVVRAASPVLLRVITLGAFFVYCTMVVMYPPPCVATCTARVWLREIGFSLTYGALMLKTWRISVIFRVRSAKAVKITDADLLKRLGGAVAVVSVFLGIRTLVAPPEVIVGKTADDLKAYLCSTDWWDHSFTSLEVCFLIWGIRLCIVVRKAPSEFNESRFISMAIYNEFLLSLFLNISMLFLQSPANPDLLYMIFFCHTQLTITLLLCLIFGSKAYMVFKGRGKWCSSSSSEEGATGVGGVSGLGASRAHAAKFLSKPSSSSYTRSEQSLAVPSHPPTLQLPSSTSPSAPIQPNPAIKSGLPPQKDQSPTLHLITDPQEEWDRIVKQIHSLGSRLSEKDEAATSLASKLALVLEVAAGGGSSGGGAGYGTTPAEAEADGEGGGKKNRGGGVQEEEGGGEEEEEGRGKKRMRWRRRKKEAEEAGGAYPPHRAPWSGGGEEWSGGAVRKRRRRGGGKPEGGGGTVEGEGKGGEGGARRQGNDLRSGHTRTHAIVIDLDDKNRFTEEVTV